MAATIPKMYKMYEVCDFNDASKVKSVQLNEHTAIPTTNALERRVVNVTEF